MDNSRYYKNVSYTIKTGATFYKAKDSSEGYYHICKDINPRYMPEIFRHDVKNVLYLNNERLAIKYCPLCAVKLTEAE